jgi:hypothetical protein
MCQHRAGQAEPLPSARQPMYIKRVLYADITPSLTPFLGFAYSFALPNPAARFVTGTPNSILNASSTVTFIVVARASTTAHSRRETVS